MMIEAAGGTVHWLDSPDGLRLRAAHFPGGPRGTVLLLNGRTEFIEKYLEPVAELRSRGFSVWTQDWRGQGLSSRLLPDPIPNHAVRFDDHLADLDMLLDRLVLPGLAGPLVLVAHSMGGHLGVHALARRPGLFARAVLCAPMIDFKRGRLPRGATRLLIRLACLRPGQAARPGPGVNPLPPLDRPFPDNPLTTCPERYAADTALMREQPALQVGGPTWGWLRAATAGIAALHRPGFAQAVELPVLVLVAGGDRLVDNRAIRAFAARLPDATVAEFPGAEHELLREHDRHRHAAWAAIDRFLAPVAAPPA